MYYYIVFFAPSRYEHFESDEFYFRQKIQQEWHQQAHTQGDTKTSKNVNFRRLNVNLHFGHFFELGENMVSKKNISFLGICESPLQVSLTLCQIYVTKKQELDCMFRCLAGY